MQSVLRFLRSCIFRVTLFLRCFCLVNRNRPTVSSFLKKLMLHLISPLTIVCLGTSRTLRLSSFFLFSFSYVLLCCFCFCLGRTNVSIKFLCVYVCVYPLLTVPRTGWRSDIFIRRRCMYVHVCMIHAVRYDVMRCLTRRLRSWPICNITINKRLSYRWGTVRQRHITLQVIGKEG